MVKTAPVKKTTKKDEGKPAAKKDENKPKKGGKQVEVKEKVHKERFVTECSGDNALTIEQIDQILGWEEVDVKDAGIVPELFQLCGRYVRLNKNRSNRPLIVPWLLKLKQEHLRKQMKFNGENIIIGEYDNLLSGQHRLISAKLAEFERTGKDKLFWGEFWDGPITFETFVAYGISEDDDTFRTLNQGYKASIADSLYRSPHFAMHSAGDRKLISRMAEYAINFLWKRTGAGSKKINPHSYSLTPGEAFDFIENHPRVIRCVRHVFGEYKNDWQANSKRLSASYAAGLMYLMGASESDGEEYRNQLRQGLASEKDINWDMYDAANKFWVGVCDKNDSKFQDLRDYMDEAVHHDTHAPLSIVERICVFCKAWNQFKMEWDMTREDIELRGPDDDDPDYVRDRSGISHLVNFPDVGGIDNGEPDRNAAAQAKVKQDDPEEIEKEKEKVRKENEEKEDKKRKPKADDKPKEESLLDGWKPIGSGKGKQDEKPKKGKADEKPEKKPEKKAGKKDEKLKGGLGGDNGEGTEGYTPKHPKTSGVLEKLRKMREGNTSEENETEDYPSENAEEGDGADYPADPTQYATPDVPEDDEGAESNGEGEDTPSSPPKRPAKARKIARKA
jgi:hypothetical protein